jgi:hypothetical protein
METTSEFIAAQVVKQMAVDETKCELTFDSIQSYHATSAESPTLSIKATTTLEMLNVDGRWVINSHHDNWYSLTSFNL